MSDRFSPISLRQLISMILSSFERGHIFGIYRSQFFHPRKDDIFKISLFDQALETPIGVAAGPHTQMAQNIVSAWLCGARYIELKTVQTLDEIEVSKPCIDMQDEGYNCEWSQELKIEESFREYLKAWILVHILHHHFNRSGEIGTIFNMSIGYDMAGILKENVQWFFEKMANCSDEKQQMIKEIRDLYPAVDELDIPDRISNNITLSTMHGCPPGEIEKIGKYLLEKKHLHTLIKLNPTLLGQERIREILKKLNFDTRVPDVAYEHDISYSAAVDVIDSLQTMADKQSLFFGVKLTNTLESINHKNLFSDESMYMSGKALHPISINVARKVRNDFPDLAISFCAGVNALNITDVLASGLKPVTVCSDLLKPGGYARLKQYLENIRSTPENDGSRSLTFLNEYADRVIEEDYYRAAWTDIKIGRELTEFDCIAAPCEATCPSNQQIPDYMYWTAKGDLSKAFEVILRTNPFPSVTGLVCDHLCQTKCTRINYDSSLLIRDIKRYIAENVDYRELQTPEENGQCVAIIGAGPSGLSCAYFLRLAGFTVEVYETKAFPGGMLADAIPLFRLSEEALKKDIERIEKLGVIIYTNYKIDTAVFEKIHDKSDYIYLAVGAQKTLKVPIPGDEVHRGLLDPLKFLSAVRQGIQVELGKNVIVLGGGNTAIDAARTAKRIISNKGNVSIVYRRTRREMPADNDEIQAALDEGIELIELAAPAKIQSEKESVVKLTCYRMRLGDNDNSGRPRPVIIPGSEFNINGDTIIPAFGQVRIIDFIEEELLKIRDDKSHEIQLDNVFIGGDAFRGAANIITAIADGRKTAETIIQRAGLKISPLHPVDKQLSRAELHQKRSRIIQCVHPDEIPIAERDYFNLVELSLTEKQASEEARRCLYCDQLCDICVTVCPNRANVAYVCQPIERMTQKITVIDGKLTVSDDGVFAINQKYQVLNIEDFCNECGNCATFCPSSGAPYKDKPKIALTERSFETIERGYRLNHGKLVYRDGDTIHTLVKKAEGYHFESPEFSVRLNDDFLIEDVIHTSGDLIEWSTSEAIRMAVIRDAIRQTGLE